ncbi:MAG: alcohol dehydrogenase catalytic domain-containing protein [Hespellia sp.]|nr:alcohol dehydrogenase catalytic domain-containing protein [Hespellia sp.]
MQALYFDGKEPRYQEDYQKPQPKAGHSLIRVLMSAICNTDREVLRGYRPDFRGVLGHEFVGIVEESDRKELIGKRVVGELNEGCGHCIYCRSGREKHCPDRKVIGMEGLDGTFEEYFVLANHLIHVVPDSLPTEKAIYTEPLAAALEIPNQLHIRPEDNVAVIGDGRLALLITEVISLLGVDLTVIGKHPEKLKYFSKYAKIERNETDSYEVVIDATGSPGGIELARQIVRKKGTIVLKSTYAGSANIDLSYFVVNEITIVGSRCGPFRPALELLNKGLVELPEIELWKLAEYENAFASKAFKVGFDFR